MKKLIIIAALVLPMMAHAKDDVPICNKPTKDASFAACQNAIRVGDRVSKKLEEIYRRTGATVAILSRLTSRKMKMSILADTPVGLNINNPIDFQTFKASATYQNINDQCKRSTKESSDARRCVSKTIKKAFPKDRSREMEYFHAGFATRNHPKAPGRWVAVHELKPQGANRADICEQDLPLFYLDELNDYTKPGSTKEISTIITIPKYNVRFRLEQILLSKEKTNAGKELWLELKGAKYNAAARPFQQDFKAKRIDQNSNQWILELLAAAQTPYGAIQTRADAQDVLQTTNYLPTKVKMHGIMKLAGLADMFKGNISLKKQEFKGIHLGEIISDLSIHEYLKRNNLITSQHKVTLPRSSTVLKTSDRKCSDFELN